MKWFIKILNVLEFALPFLKGLVPLLKKDKKSTSFDGEPREYKGD